MTILAKLDRDNMAICVKNISILRIQKISRSVIRPHSRANIESNIHQQRNKEAGRTMCVHQKYGEAVADKTGAMRERRLSTPQAAKRPPCGPPLLKPGWREGGRV